MKFIHISDGNLGMVPDGNRPWAEARKKELWDSFAGIIDVCNRERADLLLIAGDLFYGQPLLKDLKEAAYQFGRLDRTQVVMIAGDRDYIRRGSFYEIFTWPEHVHFLKSDQMDEVYFPFLDTRVWGLSYHKDQIAEPLLSGLRPEIDDSYRILLGHGGDERHIPLSFEDLKVSGFHYVALGHRQNSLIYEREMAAYSGSLEPYSLEGCGKTHGYILGEINDNRVSVRLVPFAKREYKKLYLGMDSFTTDAQLESNLRILLEDQGTQNLYDIVLRGEKKPGRMIDTERLYLVGNIIRITDETDMDIPYEQLRKTHEKDLIGKYIDSFDREKKEDVDKKALEYGVMALLPDKESEGEA